jgi:hypothetical protein
MSINSIEKLPNETFYEIFDYFDGCDIHHSFSNLNYRFQQLINSSLLLLKIKFGYSKSKEIFLDYYEQICLQNKNQILSINLWALEDMDEIISSITFDSSFNSLESLIFNTMEPDVLNSLLQKLSSLPRLFSLTIDAWSSQKHLGDVYRLLFNLPKLRYLKYNGLECDDSNVTISLPVAANKQMTAIEHLMIDHPCAVDELFAILSYTPHLRRLKFSNLTDRNVNINLIEPVMLPNLTHLSIQIYEISFDEFESFINKLNVKLKVLSLTTIVEDTVYLDANRWEKLILNKLPQLEKFYLKYSAYFKENYQTPMYFGKRDQFSSSFWLERRWMLDIETEFENLIYSIRPYKYARNKCVTLNFFFLFRKRWYEYDTQYKMKNSFDQLSKSTRLTIDNACPEQWTKTKSLSDYINHALTVTQIYHLTLPIKILSGALSEILRLLPGVNSLKIYSLPVSQLGSLSKEELEFLCFLSTKNQITKIYLQNMDKKEELYMLAFICPRINHLQIKCVNYMHAELLTGLILTQIKSEAIYSLRLLSFHVPEADDEMVQKLENMINLENLRLDFVIKRVIDKIYLHWK